MKLLVTGGAGFVGSNLAIQFKRQNFGEVVALDNLKRRGSELTLARLSDAGVRFQHGDIRNPEDLDEVGAFDVLLECSAEPSVHAGYGGSPAYLIQTNLVGTVNCLEAARRHGAAVLFLSTSRVYPIAGLRALPLTLQGERLAIGGEATGQGWSAAGISNDFPLRGSRSMYGATKLASELLLEEYGALYGMRWVVNRCGVLAGPWQMGKVDQGFITLWAARHLFGGQLAYIGFGGKGHQVRDVLHVDDLFDLVSWQISSLERCSGSVFNVGGGLERSVSLTELTRACEARAKQRIAIGSDADTRAADVPWYVTDNSATTAAAGWRPRRSVDMLLDDVFQWLRDHRALLEPILK